MSPELILPLLAAAVQSGTPILYATLGEIFTEKSGILNLGVEGIMMIGALAAFVATKFSGSPVLGVFDRWMRRCSSGQHAWDGLFGIPGQPGGFRAGADHTWSGSCRLFGHTFYRTNRAGVYDDAGAHSI